MYKQFQELACLESRIVNDSMRLREYQAFSQQFSGSKATCLTTDNKLIDRPCNERICPGPRYPCSKSDNCSQADKSEFCNTFRDRFEGGAPSFLECTKIKNRPSCPSFFFAQTRQSSVQ